MLSRVLPSTSGLPSVYETIKEHDRMIEPDANSQRDAEDYHDDTAIDEHNLQEPFQDHDLGNLLVEAAESQIEAESTPFLDSVNTGAGRHATQPQQPPTSPTLSRGFRRPRWMRSRSSGTRHFAEEDDVPESLLLEDNRYKNDSSSPEAKSRSKPVELRDNVSGLPAPVPGPSNRRSQAQWTATRNRQALHNETQPPAERIRRRVTQGGNPSVSAVLLNADPAEKALWRWTNVENLDNFLNEIYVYFQEKGIYSIILTRLLGLLTTAFVVGIVTFLANCIDYRLISNSRSLDHIMIPRCTAKMSTPTNLFIWLFAFLWVFKLLEYMLDIRRLKQLHDFYFYLLEIPDGEMQTISWQEIVERLMNLRDANPRTAVNKLGPQVTKFLGGEKATYKQRMDAHDIANRLMRRENYLIALFNKDILDLTLPLPFLRNRQLFSKTLEWNINLAVIDYVFTEQGQVRQLFLKDTERQRLIEALQRRFRFYALTNVIFAPFIIAYLLFFYFLRYFTEFRTNPSQLGSRAYTPLAEWKFREFNELRHLFERRTDMSYPYASRYMDQFPKHKTVELAKFISFIAGALAAILGIVSFLDPELSISFEITPNRTILFYFGVFGTVWAVARGMVPDENLVFDPEFAIQEVINFTHYYPSHWKKRLHTDDVKREFSSLYQLKLLIFVEEILSIVFTPFVLWFSLPKCSERLVDFFREFTIHVDGLGYVCSFALFDFKKGRPIPSSSKRTINRTSSGGDEGNNSDPRGDYYSSKDGKMLASYYSFLDSYAHNSRRRNNNGHHHHAARQFQPPPSFPGLSSSAAQMPGRASTHQIRDVHSSGTRETGIDPSPSMLLDAHHQPAVTGGGGGRGGAAAGSLVRSTMSRRRRASGNANASAAAAAAPPPSSLQHQATASPLNEEPEEDADAIEGEESYELTAEDALRGNALEGDEGGQESATASASGSTAGAGGVLGLLYQFQKAQTEPGRGKVAGIGI